MVSFEKILGIIDDSIKKSKALEVIYQSGVVAKISPKSMEEGFYGENALHCKYIQGINIENGEKIKLPIAENLILYIKLIE